MAEWAYVALGSNLGDRAAMLAQARDRIRGLPHTELRAESAVEETAPLGPVAQGSYLNQMVLVSTELQPRALLDALLHIEADLGRRRTGRWGPRPIDLDIVRFGTQVIRESGLIVPHPELLHRAFWQRELAELERHAR